MGEGDDFSACCISIILRHTRVFHTHLLPDSFLLSLLIRVYIYIWCVGCSRCRIVSPPHCNISHPLPMIFLLLVTATMIDATVGMMALMQFMLALLFADVVRCQIIGSNATAAEIENIDNNTNKTNTMLRDLTETKEQMLEWLNDPINNGIYLPVIIGVTAALATLCLLCLLNRCVRAGARRRRRLRIRVCICFCADNIYDGIVL